MKPKKGFQKKKKMRSGPEKMISVRMDKPACVNTRVDRYVAIITTILVVAVVLQD